MEERAALLTTTRAIASLIGAVLDAREASEAARLEEQRRAHGVDVNGYRAGAVERPPMLTAESLIAELEAARRGTVRTMRKRIRPFGTALLAAGWSR